jgi:hypothetical protein
MKIPWKFNIIYGAFVLYAILFWLLAKYFLYAIGPDFINYVAIAEFYSDGAWSNAINTWWSPFYSWFLAPWLKLGISALWANKIVHFFTGLYFMAVLYMLLRQYLTLHKTITILFGCTPFVLFHTLVADTPDTIAAALTLHFLLLLTSGFSLWNKKTAILLGVVGGFAYLAKSFNFYFIGASSVVTILLAARYRGLERAILQAIKVGVPFVAITSVWVFCMLLKSDKVLISSRAEPKPCYIDTAYKQGNVYDCAGLGIANGSKYSNWEQPYLYEVKDFFYGGIVKDKLPAKLGKNAKQYYKNYVSFLLLPVLLLGAIVFRKKINTISILWVAYFTIYLFGHFIFHLEPRFFIMPMVLASLVVVFIADLFNNKFVAGKYHYIIPCLLALWLGRNAVLQLTSFKMDQELTKTLELADNEKKYKGKKIAGDFLLFNQTLYFSFFNGAQSLGALARPYDKFRDAVKLHTVKADYLITKDSTGNLRLLSLK